jgi:hypothetical protein
MAVQLLNKVLSNESSSEVIDSFVLRNSQLLLGAKCYKTIKYNASKNKNSL